MMNLRKIVREQVSKIIFELEDDVQKTIDQQIQDEKDRESDLAADKKAFASAKDNVPTSKTDPTEKVTDAAQKTYFSKKSDELDAKIKKSKESVQSLETAKKTTDATKPATSNNADDLKKQFDDNLKTITNKPT